MKYDASVTFIWVWSILFLTSFRILETGWRHFWKVQSWRHIYFQMWKYLQSGILTMKLYLNMTYSGIQEARSPMTSTFNKFDVKYVFECWKFLKNGQFTMKLHSNMTYSAILKGRWSKFLELQCWRHIFSNDGNSWQVVHWENNFICTVQIESHTYGMFTKREKFMKKWGPNDCEICLLLCAP